MQTDSAVFTISAGALVLTILSAWSCGIGELPADQPGAGTGNGGSENAGSGTGGTVNVGGNTSSGANGGVSGASAGNGGVSGASAGNGGVGGASGMAGAAPAGAGASPVTACAPLSFDWFDGVGGPDYDAANGVAIDGTDNLLVAEDVTAANFAGKPLPGVVAVEKYSPVGKELWATSLATAGNAHLQSVAADANSNAIVSGIFGGNALFGSYSLTSDGPTDMVLVKLDPDGIVLWAKQYGDEGQTNGTRTATDSAGNIFVGSTGYANIDYGLGADCAPVPATFAIAKLDPDGNCQWSRGWAATAGLAMALAVEPTTSEVALGLNLNGTINFGSGVATPPSAGGMDAAVTKFSADGTPLWSQRFGNTAAHPASTPEVHAVAVLPNGDVVAAGTFNDAIDFGAGVVLVAASGAERSVFLAVLAGATGQVVQERVFSDVGSQDATALSVGPGPTIALVGSITDAPGASGVDFGGGPLGPPAGSQPGQSDIFLSLFEGDLSPCFSNRWGDTASQVANGVAFRTGGRVAMSGAYYGTLTFAGKPHTATQYEDGFVVTFKP